MKKTTYVTLRIEPSELPLLKEKAKEEGRSMASTLRMLLLMYLKGEVKIS